jgi:hypothetical protein
MKKLKHYPGSWQVAPFSMEMFAHFEQEARLRNIEAENKRTEKKVRKATKEKKPKFKLAWN